MKPPLVAGVDYYLEDGKIVLTSVYHLKRGFCCNSRCRHCPYRADREASFGSDTVRIVGLPGPVKMPIK
jgi:hypothetical protein